MVGRNPNYGPPWYDVSNQANQELRLSRQLNHDYPVYSSDWKSFQDNFLNNNRYIEAKLYKLAQKAAFAIRREIPIGEKSSDGHLRNKVKAHRVRRGGYYRDRTVYDIHGGGVSDTDKAKWQAAVFRSTYTSAEAFRKRRAGGVGAKYSWLKRAERRLGNG